MAPRADTLRRMAGQYQSHSKTLRAQGRDDDAAEMERAALAYEREAVELEERMLDQYADDRDEPREVPEADWDDVRDPNKSR